MRKCCQIQLPISNLDFRLHWKLVLATLATLATFAATAAETFCNPMPIPDTPVGVLCRDARNGDVIPESGWMRDCWARAACNLSEVRQYRELADPVVLAEGDTWYLYSSAGLMWTSEDFGGTWHHVPVQEEAGYAPAVAKFRGKYYLCTSGGPLSVADSPTGPFRTLGRFDLASFSSDPQMPHARTLIFTQPGLISGVGHSSYRISCEAWRTAAFMIVDSKVFVYNICICLESPSWFPATATRF